MQLSESESRSLREWQDRVLPGVSRTFALTIPQLPPPLRCVVTNLYLLCRIADTIEDESALTAAQKQRFLNRFVRIVSGCGDAQHFAAELAPLLVGDALDAEKQLVSESDRAVAMMRTFTGCQRSALMHCLTVMCRGMFLFDREASTAGLPDRQSLAEYCYCVAGVVGESLTELFCDYSPAIARHHGALRELGVSLGQGLQMVNILKDVWEDHDRGVCWLPQDLCRSAAVDPRELRRDRQPPGFGKIYTQLIAAAHAHLRDGVEYVLLIPPQEPGIRRFCLLALALALQTLRRLQQHPQFSSAAEVKVSHAAVFNTLLMSRVAAGSDRLLRRWLDGLARGLPLSHDECDLALTARAPARA